MKTFYTDKDSFPFFENTEKRREKYPEQLAQIIPLILSRKRNLFCLDAWSKMRTFLSYVV